MYVYIYIMYIYICVYILYIYYVYIIYIMCIYYIYMYIYMYICIYIYSTYNVCICINKLHMFQDVPSNLTQICASAPSVSVSAVNMSGPSPRASSLLARPRGDPIGVASSLRAVGRGAVGSQGYGKMVVLRNGYKCG